MIKKLQLFLFLLVPISLFAQAPSFEVRIENEQLVSSTEYQFDINMYATGSTTSFEMAGFTVGIGFNSNWKNNATISTTSSTILMSGSSDMNTSPNQVPSSATIISSAPYRIQIASTSAPGAGAGTIITQAGKRLIRVKLLATSGSFSSTYSPDLYWLFSSYATSLSAYINSINTTIAGSSSTPNNGVTPSAGVPNLKSPKYWNGSTWNSLSWSTGSTYNTSAAAPVAGDIAHIYTGTYSGNLISRSLSVSYLASDSFSTGNYHSISGNMKVDGVLNASQGTLLLTGADQTITGNGTSTLRSLKFSGSGTKYWSMNGLVTDSLIGSSSSLSVSNLVLKVLCTAYSSMTGGATYNGALNAAPVISSQPYAAAKTPGMSHTFSVTAFGTGNTYQWYKNNTAISGATQTSLTKNSLSYVDSGYYKVGITNSCGTTYSDPVYLSVINGVTITLQPQSTTSCTGNKTTLRVQAYAASGTLSFQWKKNGTAISGATDSVYVINTTALSDSGNYSVYVADQVSNAQSNTAVLSVLSTVAITSQPVYAVRAVGSSVSFSVSASGSGTITYQWLKAGNMLSGATTSTYSIASPVLSDSGAYTVNVTGTCGTVSSSIARLYMYNAVTFTKQPSSAGVCLGQSITLVGKATAGLGTVKYQWKKNSTIVLNNKVDTFLTLSPFGVTDTASYTLVASDSLSTTISQAAYLSLTPATAITSQPQNTNVNIGDNTQISVIANGSNLSYQWYKNSVLINGANNAALSINNATTNDAGNYSVVVTGDCGSVTSNTVTLTINYLQINTQPNGTSLCPTGTYTLSVSASGSGTISYKWRKDGNDINGANQSTYTINNATSSDAGTYTCIVSNGWGSLTTNDAIITVKQATNILIQPNAQVRTEGQNVQFISSANGQGMVSYQWRKDNVPINGATDSVLNITSIMAADSGLYSVVATAGCGGAQSAAVKLTVQFIRINTQPQSTIVCPNTTASLGIMASGNTAISYQWFFKGNIIVGATGPYYTINATTAADTGLYSVSITNVAGNISSNSARVSLKLPTTISLQPVGITRNVGDMAIFYIQANGTGKRYYQWYKNGIAIPSANDSVYMLNNLVLSDAGDYTVNVTADCGTIGSAKATLSLNYLTIVTQPQSYKGCAGTSTTLSISAIGNGSISYMWKKNNVPVSGATGPNLELKNITSSDIGSYVCDVTNAFGTLSSTPAIISLNQGTTIQQFPGPIQIRNAGSTAQFTVNAKGTGNLTYQWMKAGIALSGKTDSILSFTGLTQADSGSYSVTVTGECNSASSSSFNLIISNKANIYITKQPIGTLTCAGTKVILSVSALGNSSLSYQWKRSGLILPNGLDSVLVLSNVSNIDAGDYTVDITSNDGTITSDIATLNLKASTQITTQPASTSKLTNANVSFFVIATGTGNITYQWYKDGLSLSGKTGQNLDLLSLKLSDSGYYYVQVSSECNSIFSDSAKLTVNKPGGIATILNEVSATVFPIPTQRQVHVQIPGFKAGMYSLQVVDMQGKIVQKQNAAMNPEQGFDYTFELPDGMYLLEIHSDRNNQFTRNRIIIQH